MSIAQHSNDSMEHGTPAEVVELARYVGGRIHTDPFSSAYFNTNSVKADTFYDKDHDGLRSIWSGFCLVNPPGGVTKTDPVTKKRTVIVPSLVRPAWESLVDRWRRGAIDGALWVSFTLEYLCQLQDAPACPTLFPTCIPATRLRYLYRPQGGGPPKPGTSPPHASALTILPSRRDPHLARAQLARFVERGANLGAVVRPL